MTDLPRQPEKDDLAAFFKKHENVWNVGHVTEGHCKGDFLILDAHCEFEDLLEVEFPGLTLDESIRIMGYVDWGYSDSYRVCGNCNNAVNTDGSMYPLYWIDTETGELICHECTDGAELEKYIEQAKNNPENAVFWSMVNENDLEIRGWRKVAEYATDDAPGVKDVDDLLKNFPGADVLRRIKGISLGYYDVDVWVKNFLIRSESVRGLVEASIREYMIRMDRYDRRMRETPDYLLDSSEYLKTAESRLEMACKVEVMRRMEHDLKLLFDEAIEQTLDSR